MKKVSMLSILAIALFFTATNFLTAQSHNETYKDVEMLDISTITGDIIIKKGSTNEVSAKGKWDDDQIRVKVDFDGTSLRIEEKKRGNNVDGHASTWTLMVPDGLDLEVNSGTGSLSIAGVEADLDANSGTGSISITDMEGRFDVNSGTGDLELENVKGKFDLNSGTGDVMVMNGEGKFDANSGTGDVKFKKVQPTGHSTLNSGTGDVKFVIVGDIKGDLELNSGTGYAVLDFDGQKIEGDFEMKCGIRSGRIVAPFKFDSERQVGHNGNGHIEKSAKIGNADFDVEISTGTGKAEVKS
ncbi:MAG: hypothetical protein AAGJ18_13995 [Bacteroidota bacterium]